MFINRNRLIEFNPVQLNYGVAITDIDNDGQFEAVVASFGGSNLVLKWDATAGKLINTASELVADVGRQAIGVAGGDIDGDGIEELYILNTDSFAGRKRFADRLFDFAGGEWVDLFSLSDNAVVLNLTAGRSVICVDRFGEGYYGFYVANYGGPTRLYELDADGRIQDVAAQAGINLITGGRGAISLPLLSDRMDIFAANERGGNFLFRNLGDGTFKNEAAARGIDDEFENGRGLAALDSTGNGRFDIAYGNWEGPSRFFEQSSDGRFVNHISSEMETPGKVRTVIAADFDNDGYEELFFNYIGEPNRLFRQTENGWMATNIGEAIEHYGMGTGAAVADLDGDGFLELIVSHGEMAAQPLAWYHTSPNDNHWLRIRPLTQMGAPARGAVVTLYAGGRMQLRSIDAGSGYLCQMEPVAHFGLGKVAEVDYVTVRWPNGEFLQIDKPSIRQTLTIRPKSE